MKVKRVEDPNKISIVFDDVVRFRFWKISWAKDDVVTRYPTRMIDVVRII